MAGFLKSSAGPPPMCPVGKNCWEWARKYMKHCLCSRKDGVSLGLGLISVMSWGVAEIPQIITNYKRKSTESLSLLFLLTWIVGDLLNLFGCMLEPATLPSQYYVAILYMMISLILAAQFTYYGYIYRLKYNNQLHEDIPVHAKESTRENNHELDNGEVHQRSSVSGIVTSVSGIATSSPIPLPARPPGVTSGTELYYSSARSLSVSHTPPAGSLVVHRTSETDTSPSTVPLLGSVSPIEYSTSPKIKATLCMVSFVTFCLSSLDLQKSESGRVEKIFQAPSGVMNQLGRRLLLTSMVSVRNSSSRSSNTIGTFLGWGMAAVYIGGRFPQILRNIRRGNAEGLNPLMFFFAVIGNITYMSSILVSSLEWSKIRANLPWLVDAVGCGLLDIFILFQFIYFHYRARR